MSASDWAPAEVRRLELLCEAKDAEIEGLRTAARFWQDRAGQFSTELSEAKAQIAMQAEAINSTLSAIKYAEQYNHLSDARDEIANAWDIAETKLMEANLATSETVAAWRAKEQVKWGEEGDGLAEYQDVLIESLRREVAMLRDRLDDALSIAEQGAVISNYSRDQLEEKIRKAEDKVTLLSSVVAMLRDAIVTFFDSSGYDCTKIYKALNDNDTQATALAYEREVGAKALEEMACEMLEVNEGHMSALMEVQDFIAALNRRSAELRAANKGEVK